MLHAAGSLVHSDWDYLLVLVHLFNMSKLNVMELVQGSCSLLTISDDDARDNIQDATTSDVIQQEQYKDRSNTLISMHIFLS